MEYSCKTDRYLKTNSGDFTAERDRRSRTPERLAVAHHG